MNIDTIVSAQQDKLAMQIHNNYVSNQTSSSATESNQSTVDWHALPESLKDANRAQADHIATKYRIIAGGAKFDVARLPTSLDAERLEHLSRIEHQRWVAEKRLSGWRHAPTAKDSTRRTSPSLVVWEQLPEIEKEKDRDVVRQALELTRSYWPELNQSPSS